MALRPLLNRITRRASSGPTVALAGAGYIAVIHALAARDAGIRVRSVASKGGSSARHLAGELDARRCSLDQLPDGADLLVVATPSDSHVALALQALERGAAVLVEKPLAPTLADADRLVDAAQGATRPVTVGENLLHAPSVVELLQRRAYLGELGHLSMSTLQPAPDWGHYREPLGDGGVLYDLGPHAVAVVLACAGEAPVAVTADLESSRADGADDDARVRISFVSGLQATVHVSWTAPDVRWEVQAASDSGVLRLELLPEVRLEASGVPVTVPDRFVATDPSLERYGYIDQLRDAASSAPKGQTTADARAVLEVICAAYASAATGEPVPLPFDGDRSLTPMQLWRGKP